MSPPGRATLADLATADVVGIGPRASMAEAVRLMADKRISCLLVLEGGRPVGILTERDIVKLAHVGYRQETPVAEVMVTPLVTAPGDLDFRAGQLRLLQHGIRHLVVVDGRGELIGVVSESDFRSRFGRDVYERLQGLETVLDFWRAPQSVDMPFADALTQMAEKGLEYVLVSEGDKAVGILTERDLPRLLSRHSDPAVLTLGEVMSSPLLTVPIDVSVGTAVETMARRKVRHLGVVDVIGRTVGVVSQHKLLERLGMLHQEESLAHLETRLAWLLDATEVGTWEYDHRRRRLTCNGTLGAVLTECGAQADFDAWLSGLLDQEPAGVPYWTADFQMQSPSGSVRWLSLRGQASRLGETGEALSSAGIAFEVTEARRLQRDLEAERSRLRTLIGTVPNLIWLKDPDGVYLSCNPMFEKLYGAVEADIVGRRDEDFVDPSIAKVFCEGDQRAIEAGGPITREEWVTFANDGHRALMETIKTPMYDANGLLVGVLGIARDITANYRYQQQLTRQVEELRRWHDATLGREMRILELKREVNALLAEQGQPPRYQSPEARRLEEDPDTGEAA